MFVQNTQVNCPICLEAVDRLIQTRCYHNFCVSCIVKWFDQPKSSCPLCRRVEWIQKQDIPFKYRVKKAWNKGREFGEESAPLITGFACMCLRVFLSETDYSIKKSILYTGLVTCLSICHNEHINKYFMNNLGWSISYISAFFSRYDSALLGAFGYSFGKTAPVKKAIAVIVASAYAATKSTEIFYERLNN